MIALFVMLAIWVIIGLLMGVVAGSIWKGERPIGETGDYLVSIAAAVLTGLADWYLLPMMGIMGTLKFLAAVVEPAIVALIVLWIVRAYKKRQSGG